MFTKILVCIGSVEFPEKLTEYITTQAKESKGSVVLVKIKSATPPLVAVNSNDQFPIFLSTNAVSVMEKEADKLQSHVEEIAVKLSEQGIMVEQTNTKGINIHDIAKFAKENVVDLIVMTAQAHKGWKRLFKGSNIEDVLRESNIPLLAFNPENCDTVRAG